MVAAEVRLALDALVADYVARNPRSRELAARAQASLPGGNTRTGVWLDPFPPYVQRAESHYLHDADGHRLLDFTFNNSSMILGHAHPAVVEAIQRQVTHGTGVNRPTELEIELAELLKERLPSLELLRFCNSGTEAVINALRAAIGFTGKRSIAKMEAAYHGIGDHALVSYLPPIGPDLGPPERPRAVPSSAGLSGAADEVVALPFNDLAACERIIAEHADRLAAVIVDPLMTNAGVIVPAPGFLAGLREATRRHRVLLIFDEIISFRVAAGGAQELYGIRPDLTTLGKVAAGGTAGGVFGGRADVMALYDPSAGARIPQSGTFNGNPITMVAGLTTLRLLTPEVYARMAALGRQLADGLSATFAEAGVAGSANAVGSIFRFYCTETPPRTYRETAHDDKRFHRKLFFWLLNHDIHQAQGGYIASITDDSHLDRLLSSVRAGLRAL
jgi:glutamate-1-semialdehyde 2,1-aminomutase